MFTLSVKSNVDEALRKFRSQTAQIPKATLNTLNQIAFEVRREWVSKMPAVFDRPTAPTVRSPRYTKATAGNLTAKVSILDRPVGGRTAASEYLAPEVFGGPRPMKPSERALGHYYVPGPAAQLDRSGNINFNTLRAILSAVGGRGPAFPGRRNGGARRNRGKRYFILHERAGWLRAGVYERTATAARLVLVFVNAAPGYKAKRFDAYGLANAIAQRRFNAILQRELTVPHF